MTKQGRFAVVSWTSLALLSTSVGINALQARRIRELVEPQPSAISRVGQRAESISGIGLDGKARTFAFDGQAATVIYYFSKTCQWCERNWANARALAGASQERFRFLAVASDTDLSEFSRSRGLDFEIIGGISPETRRAFGFSATPHTVVVSSQGQISHEWTGAFNGRQQRLVESFFDLSLPGLTDSLQRR